MEKHPEQTPEALIRESAAVWDRKAEFWDGYIGAEGNAFHRELVAPAQLRLLDLRPGDSVLDIACGNGQFARAIASSVRRVVACDVSPRFIERAREHTTRAGITNVEYHVVDATQEGGLVGLGGPFDAAVCTMALMDIPVIEPLLRGVRRLLGPAGRFVFSVTHPAFNSNGARMVEELEDRDGELVTVRAMRVEKYLDVPIGKGAGIRGEPEAHYYFHRPLHVLLGACFDAGLVMDGIEEPRFPEPGDERRAFDWRNYRQIPPVLVVRMRSGREPG